MASQRINVWRRPWRLRSILTSLVRLTSRYGLPSTRQNPFYLSPAKARAALRLICRGRQSNVARGHRPFEAATLGKTRGKKFMKSPKFNDEGVDGLTYAPFVLVNALDTEYRDVRLSFSDWKWLHEKHGQGQSIGDQYIGDYYLSGYG